MKSSSLVSLPALGRRICILLIISAAACGAPPLPTETPLGPTAISPKSSATPTPGRFTPTPISTKPRPDQTPTAPLAQHWAHLFALNPAIVQTYNVTVNKSSWTQEGSFESLLDWTGVVTSQITMIQRWAGSEYTVTLVVTGAPQWNGNDVSLVTKTIKYRVTPGIIQVTEGPYTLTGYGQLTWPVTANQRWGEPPDNAAGPDVGVWRVVEVADLQISNHVLAECYHLEEPHNTGVNTIWICPGYGIAQAEVHSAATAYGEVWELQLPP